MTLRQFLKWWGEQLLSLLPAKLWRNTAVRRRITFFIDQSNVQVSAPGIGNGEPVNLGEAQLAGLHDKVDAISVQLGPKDYLVRHLTLPKLALSNLAESVGYQIPKLLPLSRDQVLFACGVADQPAPDGQASVWLAAIPRQRLASHFAGLDVALPVNPIKLDEPPAAGQPLSFSWRIAERNHRQLRRRRALWLGLAVTWAATITLLVYTQHRERQALLEIHSTLRKEAAAVSQLRERLDVAEAQLGAVLQRRQERVSTLQLLTELTETLDDGTWLVNLELQGEKLSLQGVSSTPAALIEALDSSNLLSDVRFEAAITQASRDAGSRFNISAKVQGSAPEAMP